VKVHYYSEDFQKSAVLKYLNRGNSSAESIAIDLGISLSSIYGWVKKYGKFFYAQ
jgi:transposase